MKTESELIKVFVGPEASANLIKNRLEQIGISALIKNDSSAAFFGTAPAVIDLYVQKSDLKQAEQIIKEFK